MQATLENLNEFITLKKVDRYIYTTAYKKVLKLVLEKMKDVDFVFNALNKNDILAGSYLDDLKISKPDEFDVNIRLKLPMHHSEIIVIYNI